MSVSSCKEITYFLETVSETVTCEDANYHALVIPLRPLTWMLPAPQRNDSAPDLHIRTSRHGQHI